MDPKNLSQLDPKLREAYERVMGGSSTIPQAPVQPQQNVYKPVDNPVMPTTPPPPPAPEIKEEQNPINQNTMTKPTVSSNNDLPPLTIPVADPTPAPTITPVPSQDAGAAATPFKGGAHGKKTLPILIAVALVVFFLFWAFLWIKILGVSTPVS